MATVRVDLDVTSKGEASLKSAASGLDGVGNAAKRADQALNTWTNTQQRAAQKMERMREEAIKMNEGFSSTDDKAQLLSATMSKMSTTMTSTAAAIGMPIGQLGALNAASDIAEIGFKQLTKSAVGFNVASIAVAGAGLAIGYALGTLAREVIPGLAKTMDDAADAAWRLVTGIENADRAGRDQSAEIGAINEAAVKKQIEGFLALGHTMDWIKEHYKDNTAGKIWLANNEKVAEALKKSEAIEREEAAVAKTAADEKARAAEVLARAQDTAYLALVKLRNEQEKTVDDEYKRNIVIITKLLEAEAEAEKKVAEAAKKAYEDEKFNFEQTIKVHEQERQQLLDLANALQQFADEMGGFLGGMLSLGAGAIAIMEGLKEATARANGELEQLSRTQKALIVIQGAQAAFNAGKNANSFGGAALGGAMQGAAAGAQFGPLGAVIGGVGGALLGLFGHAKKVREEMERLRKSFIESAGGLDALREHAEKAHVPLEKLFNSKNAKDLSAAITEIQHKLDLWDEAQQKLNDAVERYGFTIEELGPKFAQQKLDEKFAQLYEDYQLLSAAGVDHNAILARMGPAINEYVNAAIAAGGTVPEAMRPIIEEMIANHQLLDENGKAYESTEQAGIHFAETLTEGIARLIDKITELVNALLGIPTDINTNINTNYTTTGGGSPQEPPNGPHGEGFAEGGIATGPKSGHWELLHGREAVIPMDKPSAMSATLGGVSIHINGYNRDPRELADAVAEAVLRKRSPKMRGAIINAVAGR